MLSVAAFLSKTAVGHGQIDVEGRPLQVVFNSFAEDVKRFWPCGAKSLRVFT
jgi:hypothetical protein